MYKKALITGASSGIGRELALLLAERSIELIIHGRNIDALNALKDEIGAKTTVKICVAELASYDGTQAVLSMLQNEFPDLIINCAGSGLYGDFITHSPQEIQKMIAANVAAVVAICQHSTYWWVQEQVLGIILNVSSVLSMMPAPAAAVYGATKAFINSFSEALDVELQAKGIRVLTACPGRVATQFAKRASKGQLPIRPSKGMILDAKNVAKDILKQIDSKNPFRIIDWRYRLLLLSRKLVPRGWSMKKLYARLKARVK